MRHRDEMLRMLARPLFKLGTWLNELADEMEEMRAYQHYPTSGELTMPVIGPASKIQAAYEIAKQITDMTIRRDYVAMVAKSADEEMKRVCLALAELHKKYLEAIDIAARSQLEAKPDEEESMKRFSLLEIESIKNRLG